MTYNFGDTMWVRALDQQSIAGWKKLKPLTDKDTGQYSPPPGWAIIQNRATSYGNNNGSYSVTTLAGGSNFEERHYIEEAFDNAIDAATAAQDFEASIAFEEQRQEILSTVDSYSSSHNIIQLVTEATGHGSAVNRKRGWMKMVVDVQLMFICKPGCSGELEQRLKSTIVAQPETNEPQVIDGSTILSDETINSTYLREMAQISAIQGGAFNSIGMRRMLRR